VRGLRARSHIEAKMRKYRPFDQFSNSRDCVYCGAIGETVEHVPPRMFLDDPLPDNLETVQACKSCNHGFSLDETYVACLVECALSGSTDPAHLRREKVKRALAHSPALAGRITRSRRDEHDEIVWVVEVDRVVAVMTKIARGIASTSTGCCLMARHQIVA